MINADAVGVILKNSRAFCSSRGGDGTGRGRTEGMLGDKAGEGHKEEKWDFGGCLLLVLQRVQKAPDALQLHDDKTQGMEMKETDAECEGQMQCEEKRRESPGGL